LRALVKNAVADNKETPHNQSFCRCDSNSVFALSTNLGVSHREQHKEHQDRVGRKMINLVDDLKLGRKVPIVQHRIAEINMSQKESDRQIDHQDRNADALPE
jgi:hypothetical protein